jgi:tRNA threonylcarbamoyl adenosine modification protein YeaZ
VAVLVLALDTSSAAAIAAVVAVDADELSVRAERSELVPRGHGEVLASLVRACLDEAGIRPARLAAIVAGVGPGPFTGLRVGLVTAAVLADGLAVPAYGVCSLDAMAADSGVADLLVVTDARRREIYWARYAGGIRVAGPAVNRPADVIADDSSAVCGPGTALYPGVWSLARVGPDYPTPRGLVSCAAGRVRSGAAGEPLTPLYLRRPDAAEPTTPKPVTPAAPG